MIQIFVVFLLFSSTLGAPQVAVGPPPPIEQTVVPAVVPPAPEVAAIVETPVIKEVAVPNAVVESPGVIKGAPVHLINRCTLEHEPFETQTCTTIPERLCQPVSVVNQRISYEKKCKDIISSVCPDSDPIDDHYLVKRQIDFPHFYGPSVNLPCQDITTQHCIDSPLVVEEPATLENCNIITKVQCAPVVRQIPRQVCQQVEAPGQAGPIIDPLSYQHFFGF